MNINEQSSNKHTNGQKPKTMEDRQNLKLPTSIELMQKGGNWLGALRRWIQWNIRGGDQVTWGSNTVLPITAKTIEEAASQVAEAAMREGFVADHNATQKDIGFKQPTALTGIIGLDDNTNRAVAYIDKIGKYDPRPWELVRRKLVRLVRGRPVGPRCAPVELVWNTDEQSDKYRTAEFRDRVYCAVDNSNNLTGLPCVAKWWPEGATEDDDAYIIGRFDTLEQARACCIGHATGYGEVLSILMHQENR